MTEWEGALARVEPIHSQGRVCPQCKGDRRLTRQALNLREGIDTTVWQCRVCYKIEVIKTPVEIPS
jgi:hypothetical protein